MSKFSGEIGAELLLIHIRCLCFMFVYSVLNLLTDSQYIFEDGDFIFIEIS